MVSIRKYVHTLHRLGWANVIYAAWYKFSLKSGIRKAFFPPRKITGGTFFHTPELPEAPSFNYPDSWRESLERQAQNIVDGKLTYFFFHRHDMGTPPQWFLNPFNKQKVTTPDKHWTELSDFDLNIGDIKTIWEPSRFYWLPVLARAYIISRDERYLDVLNRWQNDWIDNNPLHIGPNWKCGQETSIRVMHLMLTARILHQYREPGALLQQMIWQHLQRIKSNINYALAQDNNHGTSEASGLYIGSQWLLRTGFDKPDLEQYRDKGLYLLEDRFEKLIGYDGTFSQYSINYHRMVLDTVSWVLWNERELNVKDGLSERSVEKIRKALNWLESLVDESGDAPNFGPNDGSLICKLDSNDYRDFHPSIRLLKTLLDEPISPEKKGKDEAMFWLGLTPRYEEQRADKKAHQPEQVQHFPESGLVRMNGEHSWTLFHYPYFRFRPSHCDFMHVDLWSKGENILRDSGSFSYNTNRSEPPDSSYFKSVKSHNTVSFDEEEPIPKISRFLYADWPHADEVKVDPDKQSCQARYLYGGKTHHTRKLQYLEKDTWLVTDLFNGEYNEVVLRWRLIPVYWKIDQEIMTVESEYAKVIIKSETSCQFFMDEGYESRYYMQYQQIPVLTIKGDTYTNKIESYIQLK